MKKRQHVFAILTKKKTYTVFGVQYEQDAPMTVNIKTARYLKNTGLFKFERIKEEVLEDVEV